MGIGAAKPLVSTMKDKRFRKDEKLKDAYLAMIQALGQTKSEKDYKVLTNLLKDKDNFVIATAAEALGNYNDVKLTIRKKETWELILTGFSYSTESTGTFSGNATFGSLTLNDGDPFRASFDMTSVSAEMAVASSRLNADAAMIDVLLIGLRCIGLPLHVSSSVADGDGTATLRQGRPVRSCLLPGSWIGFQSELDSSACSGNMASQSNTSTSSPDSV